MNTDERGVAPGPWTNDEALCWLTEALKDSSHELESAIRVTNPNTYHAALMQQQLDTNRALLKRLKVEVV